MEEQACLVRAHSDSENSAKLTFGSLANTMAYSEDRLTVAEGIAESGNSVNMSAPTDNVNTDSGELLDCNNSGVLEQFHEDALRQAGCGFSQVLVLLACFLAIAGATLELTSVPFILPSAEIELCIQTHEKSWLVLISVVGASLGGAGWGALCSRLGRRRALMSCLGVNAVFATVAAFMPTYGTFMMARFCSALGSGGIVPISYIYSSELVPRVLRARLLPVLAAAAAAGLGTAAGLAQAILPATGAATLVENKEHFSAWHRYLLLCTLPILASLVSLIWTQESPRYLLDIGREVDAMGVYQSIHNGNRVTICGKRAVVGGDECRLAELALPAKRAQPARHVRHAVKLFWQAFFELFSTYRCTTLWTGIVLLCVTAIQFYLSMYVPEVVLKQENAILEASKQYQSNLTYSELHYNSTLENIEYQNSTFVSCTFRDMLMSRVTFKNCTFVEVAFSNVKTSFTSFQGCIFINTTIIDTDMLVGRELDPWCLLNSSYIRGMRSGCWRHLELGPGLRGPIQEHVLLAQAALTASVLALFRINTVYLCAACAALSPCAYFVQSETGLYVVEAAYRVLTLLAFYRVAFTIVEVYPANLRSTALGLCVGVSLSVAAWCRSGSAAPGLAVAVLAAGGVAGFAASLKGNK